MSVEFDISEFKDLIEKANNITFGYFTFITLMTAIVGFSKFIKLSRFFLFIYEDDNSIEKISEAFSKAYSSDEQLQDMQNLWNKISELNIQITEVAEENNDLRNKVNQYNNAFKKLNTCYNKYAKKNKNKFGESESGEENERSVLVTLVTIILTFILYPLIILIIFIFMVKILKLITEIRSIEIDENNVNIEQLNRLMDKQEECSELTRGISIFALTINSGNLVYNFLNPSDIFKKYKYTVTFIFFPTIVVLYSIIISKSNGVLKKIKYYHDNEQNIKFV